MLVLYINILRFYNFRFVLKFDRKIIQYFFSYKLVTLGVSVPRTAIFY